MHFILAHKSYVSLFFHFIVLITKNVLVDLLYFLELSFHGYFSVIHTCKQGLKTISEN